MIISHRFVLNIPEKLEEGVLYISMEYATAIHLCCCGCKNEVVTPFSLTDWELKYNGKTISLSPSIGNWSFPCQSHYWISNSNVRWIPRWNQNEISQGRKKDKKSKESYYSKKKKRGFLDYLLGD